MLLLALLGVSAALGAREARAPGAPDRGPDAGPPRVGVFADPPIFVPTIDSAVAAASVVAAPPDERVAMVRNLLAGRPLQPHAQLMVETADAYGIDWRLMPVISILESSGGAAACGGNAWGYANCRVTFASFEQGIAVVAATLAAPPYPGRSTAVVLCLWVSGNFCSTGHAVDYAYRAFGLYLALGGSFALPAPVAAESAEQPHAADAGGENTPPPAPESTPAPAISPTPEAVETPSPTPEPTETAETETPAASPTPEAAPATPPTADSE